MITTVHVTQEDIDQGKPREACGCPIVHAVRRVCKATYIAATHGEVVLTDHNSYIEDEDTRFVPLPEDATLFMAKFDNRMEVQPFSFQIDIPDQYLAV